MRDPTIARKAIHFLVIVVIMQSILAGFSHRSAFGQEPYEADVGAWRRTATWTLDDSGYYTSENVTFEDGNVSLTLNNNSWSESTVNDFSDGSWDSNVTITSDGNLTLAYDDSSLVPNGDFGTDSDWVFLNGYGGNVIAERDGNQNNAHFHHFEAAQLQWPFDTLDSVANWWWVGDAAPGSLSLNTSWPREGSGSMRISWTPTTPSKWGGAYRIAATEWDWSSYNRLSLWLATNYTDLGLNLTLTILDVNSNSWDVTRENITGNWTEHIFDLDGFTGNLSRVKEIYIKFTGVGGSVNWSVSVDYLSYYRVKIFEETGYANQTFAKGNVTENIPGNVMMDFDVLIENRMNIVDSSLTLFVSNSTSNFSWEMDILAPPYSKHVTVDLSWLMIEAGDYNISLQLHLSVFTELATRYSARFDNITICAPNRKNGIYISEPYDSLTQSIWRNVAWNEYSPDPETNISIRTRTGNSSNTSDGSWSGWVEPVFNAIMSPPNRYIQYRVDLSTTNASKGPTLTDILIEYQQYAIIGTLETYDFTVSSLHAWEEFRSSDSIVPETEIFYCFSSDGGGSWVPISDGFNLSLVTNDTLRFKADFRTWNTTKSPRLLEMSITYEYTGPLDHIHMSDDYLATTANTTLYLFAQGHDVLHRNMSFNQKWETTDPIGSVDSFGNYTAGKVGTWRVYCNNSDDSISNWTVVDVAVGPLVRIGVDPWDPGTLSADDQLQFNATGYDAMDNPIPVSPDWSVLGGIGSVNPTQGPTTLFVATTVGTGRVVANNGVGQINQTNLFSVVAGQLASVVVSPPVVNLLPDGSAVFTALGYDSDGNNVPLTTTSWQTNAGSVTSSNSTTANFTAQSTELMGGYIRATQDSVFGEAVVNVNDNDEPPEIQGVVPNQEKYEDYGPWILDLTSFADDAEDDLSSLKWRITGDESSLYAITGEDIPGNHLLTFTTKRNAFGNDEVNLWLIDSQGQTASQPLWVNITPVNDKPVFITPPKVDVRFDVPRTKDYTSYISDVDNPIGDLVLTTDDPEHTTVQELQVTYEYPESMVGEPIFVTLTVSDGMYNVKRVVEVEVSSNYPPNLLTPIADITMNEDEPLENAFDMNDHFEDPDLGQLTFGSLSQKVVVSIDPSGLVSLTPAENWFGDELVIFSATDSSGAVAQDVVLVRVLPVNDPPEIGGLPDIVMHYDVAYDFDVSPYIHDVDNPDSELDISCSDDSDTFGTTIIFSYSSIGTVNVVVTVDDGEYTDNDTMRVSVTDNYPPTSEGLPHVFFNEDESLPSAFDLDDYFSDFEGDTLTYTVNQTQFFVEVTVGPDNSVSFSSAENWSGQQVVVFRAEDEAGAFVEDSIIVTVIPVNDAPFISPIPRQTGKKNKAWLLDLKPYIHDSDNSTDDLFVYADFEYVTVAGHYLIFNCEESFDLRETSVIVSDGLLQYSRSFEVSVSSYVDPQVGAYIWPTTLGLVLLCFVGLVYWRASRKYIMEDLFVVKRDGKPLVHKTIRVRPDRDEDMFSGMMTAIHAFAEDTFREEGETLKSFESQEKKVMLEAAETFYVAAIFAGKEPKWAAKSLEAFVEDIDKMYGQMISSWSGLTDEVGDLPEMVDFFIRKRKYSLGDWSSTESEHEHLFED